MALKRKEDRPIPTVSTGVERLVNRALKIRYLAGYSTLVFNDLKTAAYEAIRDDLTTELWLSEGFRLKNGLMIVTQAEKKEEVNKDKLLKMVQEGKISIEGVIAAGSFTVSKMKEIAKDAVDSRSLTSEEVTNSTVVTLRDGPDLKTNLGLQTPLYDTIFNLVDESIKL